MFGSAGHSSYAVLTEFELFLMYSAEDGLKIDLSVLGLIMLIYNSDKDFYGSSKLLYTIILCKEYFYIKLVIIFFDSFGSA
jgi:hypothetical protein